MISPLLSVLVPFYKDKNTLVHCLQSISSQNYPNIEVIIVNDGSGKLTYDGKKYSKIIKEYIKSAKKQRKKYFSTDKIPNQFSVKYIEHKKNLGIIEGRRTCINYATGKFCTFVDSDDILLPNALQTMWEIAEKSQADIVHCSAKCFYNETVPKEKIEQSQKKVSYIYEGELLNEQIMSQFFEKNGYSCFLWAKLFYTSTLQKAFTYIPSIECSFGEDFLIYYFVALNSHKYIGNKTPVYRYDITGGMTSYTKITEIQRWRQICSASSIFTILYSYFDEEIIPESHKTKIKSLCVFYLKNNLKQLNSTVASELKAEAYKVLCEYWGESFVKRVEGKLYSH